MINPKKALKRYIKSGNIGKEKTGTKKCLGEVLKQYREYCKTTQEFVAEIIGVSKQAVLKWENETSDPSTSNLIEVAKLFNISAENLMKEIQ